MPRPQRHLLSYEKLQHTSTPTTNFSCSFKISSRSIHDQNIDRKLKPLRKNVMFDDVIMKKIKRDIC